MYVCNFQCKPIRIWKYGKFTLSSYLNNKVHWMYLISFYCNSDFVSCLKKGCSLEGVWCFL